MRNKVFTSDQLEKFKKDYFLHYSPDVIPEPPYFIGSHIYHDYSLYLRDSKNSNLFIKKFMANNLVQSLAQLYAKDPKRANWLGTPSIVGTNDFGFIKVRHTEEIIPNTVYDFNFKCAFSSNPTISPVISRAKVTVCGIWIPLSLYVPSLRDGAEVTAFETDYSFPTLNFEYSRLNSLWNSVSSTLNRDKLYQYIPANSIFTELNMWEPYYTPASRFVVAKDMENAVYPKGKNAIPLLGYYDFYRHFILNSQQELFPLRLKGFSRRYNNLNEPTVQEPLDSYFTRKSLILSSKMFVVLEMVVPFLTMILLIQREMMLLILLPLCLCFIMVFLLLIPAILLLRSVQELP